MKYDEMRVCTVSVCAGTVHPSMRAYVCVCVDPHAWGLLKYAEGVVCHCASVSLTVMTVREQSQCGRSGRRDREKDKLEGRNTARQLLKRSLNW